MSDCESLDAKLNTILFEIQALKNVSSESEDLKRRIEAIENLLAEGIQIDITEAIKQAFGV